MLLEHVPQHQQKPLTQTTFVFQTLVSHPLDFLLDPAVELVIPLLQFLDLSSCPLEYVLILYEFGVDLISLFL